MQLQRHSVCAGSAASLPCSSWTAIRNNLYLVTFREILLLGVRAVQICGDPRGSWAGFIFRAYWQVSCMVECVASASAVPRRCTSSNMLCCTSSSSPPSPRRPGCVEHLRREMLQTFPTVGHSHVGWKRGAHPFEFFVGTVPAKMLFHAQ